MKTTTELTALDRCDRCGARAHVRYSLHGMDLLFCAHHDRQNRDALLARGARLVDVDVDVDSAIADLEAGLTDE